MFTAPNFAALHRRSPSRRRRKRRGPAPAKRKRRNLVKFIPSADSDFAMTARSFALYLKNDPAAFGVTAEAAAEVDQAVSALREALARCEARYSRTQKTIDRKDLARKKAEQVVRQYANIIRANPNVSELNKKLLRLKPRAKRPKHTPCPRLGPELWFRGGQGGVHLLECFGIVDDDLSATGNVRRARPDGAARLELFVDLIPPGEPVPEHPAERLAAGRGWPLYLRSFTRNPIEVQFPMPAQPMLVVYWGRWAGTTGEVSQFSKTCVARVEGWSSNAAALPDANAARIETKCVILQGPFALLAPGAHAGAQVEHVRRLPAASSEACEAA